METAAQMAARLGQYLEAQFPKSPPFTIYRIAELLSAPVRYCKDTEPHKWLAALELVIWVQSAINEFPPVIVMGGDGDNAGSNTENDTGGKDRRNGVYDSNAKRENNSTGTSTSGGGDTGPQTIEMEEISWITEEHLRQIELDQHREHEEEEEEGEEEHFEELKNENAIEYEKTTDVDSLATHTVAGADSYRSGNETAEAITARDTGAEPPALAKEDSGNEKSIPTTSSSSSSNHHFDMIPASIIAAGLSLICDHITEGDGDKYFRFSRAKLRRFITGKVAKLAQSDNFPESILRKVVLPLLAPADVQSEVPRPVLRAARWKFGFSVICSYLCPEAVLLVLTDEGGGGDKDDGESDELDLAAATRIVDEHVDRQKQVSEAKRIAEENLVQMNQQFVEASQSQGSGKKSGGSGRKRGAAAAAGGGVGGKKKVAKKVARGALDSFFRKA